MTSGEREPFYGNIRQFPCLRVFARHYVAVYDIDSSRFKIEMELNSIEAIKNAVQSGLGAAFVSVSAIAKELELGILHWARIKNVTIKRMLSIIINPNRYKSKAAETFSQEILTLFVTPAQEKIFMES